MVSSNAPLCPSQWGCDDHFKMGDSALTHQGAGQSSPLSVPIPVATDDKGRGEDRCDFHGQGSQGPRPQEAEVLTRGGLFRAAPGTWCGCGLEPTLPSQAAWGHLCGHLPHFHVKGRWGMTWGPGLPSAPGGHCAESHVPHDKGRGGGSWDRG